MSEKKHEGSTPEVNPWEWDEDFESLATEIDSGQSSKGEVSASLPRPLYQPRVDSDNVTGSESGVTAPNGRSTTTGPDELDSLTTRVNVVPGDLLEGVATKVAVIPRELLDALATETTQENTGPKQPAEQAEPILELDFDPILELDSLIQDGESSEMLGAQPLSSSPEIASSSAEGVASTSSLGGAPNPAAPHDHDFPPLHEADSIGRDALHHADLNFFASLEKDQQAEAKPRLVSSDPDEQSLEGTLDDFELEDSQSSPIENISRTPPPVPPKRAVSSEPAPFAKTQALRLDDVPEPTEPLLDDQNVSAQPPRLAPSRNRSPSAQTVAAVRKAMTSPAAAQSPAERNRKSSGTTASVRGRLSGRPEVASPGDDRGAKAALRTVRSIRPKVQALPLLGRSPDALRRRRELLRQVAGTASGALRARALMAAAEVSEQLGEAEETRQLYAAARKANPWDVVALRAVRRDAAERGAWEEVASLLEAEATLPLSPAERNVALTFLAEVSWRRLGDPAAAERAARRALVLSPNSTATALLLAEVCFAQDRQAEGFAALEKAALGWEDKAARLSLLVEVARAAELRGEVKRAEELYEQAVRCDPHALDAVLGWTRTARAACDVDKAMEAIRKAVTMAGEGPLRAPLSRAYARLSHGLAGRPEEAVNVLERESGFAAQRVRAAAAAESGDTEALIDSLEKWAASSVGAFRALALVRLAELRVEHGDAQGARKALADAALADESLSLVQVAQEKVNRKLGDVSLPSIHPGRSADTGTGAQVIAAAAKMVRSADRAQELSLLQKARQVGEWSVCADVIEFDLLGARGSYEEIQDALQRILERTSGRRRLGPLLLMHDLAVDRGDETEAIRWLKEGMAAAPGHPLVSRPLAFKLAKNAAADAALVSLDEASQSGGALGAFAATLAGRLFERALNETRDTSMGTRAIDAYRLALETSAGYAPAAWALEALARRTGAFHVVVELHEKQAEYEIDPFDTAGRLVRAALIRASDAPRTALALLERAHDLQPSDAIVLDLLFRLGEGLSASERASLLLSTATHAPPEFVRAARLRAAACLEENGEHARAAGLYRTILTEHGESDPFARIGRDRAELAAKEYSRVAERRFAAVRNAPTEEHRVAALEQLAELDSQHRGDTASAILSLQAILETAPSHLPSLRTLERYFVEQGRVAELLPVWTAYAEHLKSPLDASAYARLAIRQSLLLSESPADTDSLVVSLFEKNPSRDLWLVRKMVGAAWAISDMPNLKRAFLAMLSFPLAPSEKLSLALRIADEVAREDGPAACVAWLGEMLREVPEHFWAWEQYARFCFLADQKEQAAEALEVAAQQTRVRQHAVALWYEAAVIWQDLLYDKARATEALDQVLVLHPSHDDAYERLRVLWKDDDDKLCTLLGRRVSVTREPTVLVTLYLELSSVQERRGDRVSAKDSLRAALGLRPDDVESLHALARLCTADGDWRGAAEALIRLARLSKDPNQLQEAFFQLATIYDEHLSDARRAEAAYRQVLRLNPGDVQAMERLTALYERAGNLDQALAMLQQLTQTDVDPERNRVHLLQYAGVLERAGDLRKAEAALEQARRKSPTDLAIIRAMSDFYSRQNIRNALSVHQNRAIGDLRHAVESDPADPSAWHGLIEVLHMRGRNDAAFCCAQAALALGLSIPSEEWSKGISSALAKLDITRRSALAADHVYDTWLYPPGLTPAITELTKTAIAAGDKGLLFDLKAFSTERLRKHPFTERAEQVAQGFGWSDAVVYVTDKQPAIYLPLARGQLAVLVGRSLLEAASIPEQYFLLVRAAKVTQAGLSAALYADTAELNLRLSALVHVFDPLFAPATVDMHALQQLSRRMDKSLGRKDRERLMPCVSELHAASVTDFSRLPALVTEFADRAGLLAVDAVPHAVDALLKLSGLRVPRNEVTWRRVSEQPDIVALLRYAISDVHFELRQTAADRLKL